MKLLCEKCGDPILDSNDGGVFLSNQGRGYPSVAAPDLTVCETLHYRCAPDAYTIELDRVREAMGDQPSDSVEGWVTHVGYKVWATPKVLGALAGRLAAVLLARSGS